MSKQKEIKMGSDSIKRTPILKSVDKAFELLECFKHDKAEYSINELAKRMQVSKGTIHRIIITAQKRDFIEKNTEKGKYQLGIKLLELGSVVSGRIDLLDQSKVILEELSNKTGESAYVLVRKNDEAIGLAMAEGHNFLRMLFLETGKRMPLYIGAGPKVLLAHMDDKEIEKLVQKDNLVKWTEYTIIEPEQIWKDIANIREQGYALSSEDVTLGAAAVGAPIYNERGQVIGAVSIAGASIRFEGDNLDIYIKIIKEAGKRISSRMGYAVR